MEDTYLCQEGQRCVNLIGTYTCLPDCRPGFRVTADGKSCEGDRDTRQGLVILPEPRECHWDSGHLELSWQKPRAGILSFPFLTSAHLRLTKEGVSRFLRPLPHIVVQLHSLSPSQHSFQTASVHQWQLACALTATCCPWVGGPLSFYGFKALGSSMSCDVFLGRLDQTSVHLRSDKGHNSFKSSVVNQ